MSSYGTYPVVGPEKDERRQAFVIVVVVVVVILVIFALIAAAWIIFRSSPNGCTINGDCSTGQTCVNGTCTTPPPLTCSDGAPCPPGFLCVQGSCQPWKCRSGKCPPGYRCLGGLCFPDGTRTCQANQDCPPGKVCQSGECQTLTCSAEVQCPDGYVCRDGRCWRVSDGGGTGPVDIPCRGDRECPPSLVCIDGSCRPPIMAPHAREEGWGDSEQLSWPDPVGSVSWPEEASVSWPEASQDNWPDNRDAVAAAWPDADQDNWPDTSGQDDWPDQPFLPPDLTNASLSSGASQTSGSYNRLSNETSSSRVSFDDYVMSDDYSVGPLRDRDEDERVLAPVNSFFAKGSLFFVTKNRQIVIPNTCKVIGALPDKMSLNMIGGFRGRVLTLRRGRIYEHKLKSGRSCDLGFEGVSAFSTTLDGMYLWILIQGVGYLYNTGLALVSSVQVGQQTIVKYGQSLSVYGTLNYGTATLTLSPSGQVLQGIKDFVIDQLGQTYTLLLTDPANRIILTPSGAQSVLC